MKRLIVALTALIAITVSADAMSYEQARNEALFLTDKMAYELNLTEDQYNAAYEINLDYLMSIGGYDDLYGDYWTCRNLDLEYILADWQFEIYRAASYFYRPLYWQGGYWHFAIYGRYPHRDYFYFDRPSVYVSYRGGHSWAANSGHSFYRERHFNSGIGMRDEMRNLGQNRFGGIRNGRESSTRTTVYRNGSYNRTNRSNLYGGSRGIYGSYSSSRGTSSSGSSSFGGSRGSYSRSSASSSRNSSSRSNSSSSNSSGHGSSRSGNTAGSNNGGSHGSFGGHR